MNIRTSLILFLFFVNAGICVAQQDSTTRLEDVTIRSGLNKQPPLKSTVSAGILNPAQLRNYPAVSPVSAMNSISGLRMEERSPGSYRLSLRGSLLRSPFGIRNVKIYLDEFPLTDAGGNTYLNLVDMTAIDRIEVLKGPQSDLYGANSGGVIVIDPSLTQVENDSRGQISVTGGGYGLFRENAYLNLSGTFSGIQVRQAYQESAGYRENSSVNRKFLQLSPWFNLGRKDRLKALVLFSDLAYHTPGGLTETQYLANPAAARPAAGSIPGAADQQAAIYNRTFFTGLSNNLKISGHFRYLASVFASGTDFKNPFITNYEQRKEQTFGVRTWLEYQEIQDAYGVTIHLGAEHAATGSRVSNYQNQGGTPRDLMADDALKASQSFLFAHLRVQLGPKFQAEMGTSLNDYGYRYQTFFPQAGSRNTRTFKARLMPRLAASYLLLPQLSLRASVARGYSTPTIAEVRASDNQINTALNAEYGDNYEAGLRYEHPQQRLRLDLAVFSYRLKEAISRRLTPGDQEFFVNAGGTRQTGLEFQGSSWIIQSKNHGFMRGLEWRTGLTWSDFIFSNYTSGTVDYSGNKLTGVPRFVLVNSLQTLFPAQVSLFLQHNYTSAIPLNDANTDFASKYHLLEAKLSCAVVQLNQSVLTVFAGADNLLNQRYSLGNDLNAFGKRYYNAAALRSFYAGLSLQIR